jgi:uncharacterized protein DUF6065
MSCLIEFHGYEQELKDFPQPFAAAKAVPDWFKRMAIDVDGSPDKPTLKRCPPFLEAMTAGYIIPLPGHCAFQRDAAGKLKVESEWDIVSTHVPEQLIGSPFENQAIVKFRSPWIIRTPPGYSTLFVAPLNRFDIPFVPLSGVVETDTYYRRVHFPTVCTMASNTQFLLRAGTPLVQVIPFRRDQWESMSGPFETDKSEQIEAEFKSNRHAYRQNYWQRHEYE